MIQYLENKCIFTNKYFKNEYGTEFNICADDCGYWCFINNSKKPDIHYEKDDDIFVNFDSCFEVVKEKYGELTLITDKEKILEYMKDDQTLDCCKNLMGCLEGWYDPFYAINQTFKISDIELMTDAEINNLLNLAINIQSNLY